MSIFAEHNLSVRRSKRHGVGMCVTSCLLALALVYGLWQGSFWVLAIPVALGVLTGLWLLFWIGYTIATVGDIPKEADHYDNRGAKLIATGICVGTVLLAVVFLTGIVGQSYWALAIPVAGVVVCLLSMVFWIGWAIAMQKPTVPVVESARSELQAGDSPV